MVAAGEMVVVDLDEPFVVAVGAGFDGGPVGGLGVFAVGGALFVPVGVDAPRVSAGAAWGRIEVGGVGGAAGRWLYLRYIPSYVSTYGYWVWSGLVW